SELGEHISAVDGVVSEEQTLDYVTGLMTYTEGTPVLIDRDLVARLLKTFSMSATALNKFIRCRLSFYFENLLRVPMARSATMGYGSAIHYALEMYFKAMEVDPERKSPDPDTLTTHFIKGMKIYRSHFTQMEFDNFNILGEKILREYYDEYKDQWNTAKQTISEKNIKHTSIGEIPIKGKIDKVEIYDDHVKVIDYKTGTYKKDKLAGVSDEDQGGDYWRQLVFYKLLVDNDPTLDWKMKSGTMDFVEKAKTKVKYDKIELPISSQDEEAVTKQLQESWTAIHNYEFEQFCEDENCRWCNFVRDTSMVQPLELDESYNEE
ncbi:PD-(D/E)XK nuclease family protein, partial [Saprospiraceae bacterium]|nr:PD-(D/E)XK nuclease family protein [Saprospiraceae bacterium]